MASPKREPGLLSRYPALKKLGALRLPRSVPLVRQMTSTECGAACVAMVLGYHGKAVRLEDVREVAGIGRDGASAASIIRAARAFGLRARGVRIDLEDLEMLPRGTVLHWNFDHFVVFDSARGDDVLLVDPAAGRRRVSLETFGKAFTGIALLMEPGEDFAPGASKSSQRLSSYLRQVLGQSRLWPRILVTSVMLQLFGLAVPLLTGALVDRVVPRQDYHLLLVLCVGLAGLVIFFTLASVIRAHLLLHLRTYLEARMTLGFLDHLVKLPYAFFQRRSSGDLMMRLNSNATIREILTSGALSGVLDGTLVSFYLVILFISNKTMGVLVLALGFVQVGVLLVTRARQLDLMSQGLHVQARQQSYQVEMLAGIETLKTMGAEHRAVEHWTELFVDAVNVSIARGRLSAAVDAVTGTLRTASPILILGYGALSVLDGTMTLGSMLALTAVANGFLLPLGNLVSTAAQFQSVGTYLERINDVLDSAPEQDRTKVKPAGKLHGRVTLERVSFHYSPGAPMVVQDVSVEIKPGQFVAIVGRSGSGKSTLASLLVGLYTPTSGKILFDDTDLADLDLTTVRRQIGIVPQRPYLFGTSVRRNIAYADPAIPFEKITECARRACIHPEIDAMPMKYDTLVTDGGASLSGGQRQRLALARALAIDPALMLLDEATSALDAVTEAQVQRALASLDCTRIVIAHRLSTVRDADLILVMSDGKLVERGTHEELVALGGSYAALVAAQMDPKARMSA